MIALSVLACAGTALASQEIVLNDFTGDKNQRSWSQQNDPVMGGRSTGTFSVRNGMGVFNGTVAIVPSLKAPGFIKATASEGSSAYSDVSACKGMGLYFKNSIAYDGFRMSFGNARATKCGKFFAYGYKTNFGPVPASSELQTIVFPWGNFSDCWDDATGDPIHTCDSDPEFCPDKPALQDLKSMSIWAEGKEGDVHMEIQKVTAVECP